MQNKRILASILFVLISFVCFSQIGDPPPPPEGAPPPPPGLSIDMGIISGICFAIFYGVKRLLQKAS